MSTTPSKLAISTAAVLIAVVIGGFVIIVSGFNPIDTYAMLLRAAFGNLGQLAETLKIATPLLLIGLGIAFSFQAGAFNIGAVGQMYMGALVAVAVGAKLHSMPAPVHVVLATLAAAVAGGIWAGLSALLKIQFGTNEVITTILLNYVAIYFLDYLISGPMQAPDHYGTPISWAVEPTAMYAKLVPHSQLHAGFLLAVLAVPMLYLVRRYTTLGQQVRMVGLNYQAARYAGVRVGLVFAIAFCMSGAMAGLAGGAEVLGYRSRITTAFAPNTGYDAIAVALLGQLHPVGVMLAAVFFAALSTGAKGLEATTQMPAQLVDIVRVLAILAVLAASSPAMLGWIRRPHRKVVASREGSL